MRQGDTFQVVEPGSDLDGHVWIVISDPKLANEVLMVNFTTFKDFKDDSCIVMPGEHPFVDRKTCINYQEPLIALQSDLNRLVSCGKLRNHTRASDVLLGRILDGAAATDRISFEAEEMLVSQKIIEARAD